MKLMCYYILALFLANVKLGFICMRGCVWKNQVRGSDAHNFILSQWHSIKKCMMHLLIHFLFFLVITFFHLAIILRKYSLLVAKIFWFYLIISDSQALMQFNPNIYVYRCWFFSFLLPHVIRALSHGIYIHQRKSSVMTLQFLLILEDAKLQAFSSHEQKK